MDLIGKIDRLANEIAAGRVPDFSVHHKKVMDKKIGDDWKVFYTKRVEWRGKVIASSCSHSKKVLDNWSQESEEIDGELVEKLEGWLTYACPTNEQLRLLF